MSKQLRIDKMATWLANRDRRRSRQVLCTKLFLGAMVVALLLVARAWSA